MIFGTYRILSFISYVFFKLLKTKCQYILMRNKAAQNTKFKTNISWEYASIMKRLLLQLLKII